MKIIAGLGNPGLRYRNTRHNAGFKVVEALGDKYGIRIKKKGFGGVYGVGQACGNEVMLFKPTTYMNLSGEPLQAVCSKHLETRGELLVISDDFALPLGIIRLRVKGSSGGHNGLRSIIGRFGEDFCRLRVGIGGEEEGNEKKVFVLSSFSKYEKAELKKGVEKAAGCVETWLREGSESAMKEWN